MLKVILNRLTPQAEEIVAEEQAGVQSWKEHHRTDFQVQNLV